MANNKTQDANEMSLTGKLSAVAESTGRRPVNVQEFERHAQLVLSKGVFEYVAGGAGDMLSLRENRAAFQRLHLRPRILKDVSKIDTCTKILGSTSASPICVAPTAEHRAAHEEGEKATARAAAKTGCLMAVSSSATTSLEDVAQAGGPGGRRWLQLSLSSRKSRDILGQLIHRAIAAGYEALAISGDRPVVGKRDMDIRNAYELDYRLNRGSGVYSSTGARIGQLIDGTFDLGQPSAKPLGPQNSLHWGDIGWIRSICGNLKIVIKGVVTAEDAQEAVRRGVDAVWVSNHGGRQLDTIAATIEVLPEIVSAVKGRCEVYVDGGIRRGSDVYKALALGATAVFVGRPVIWGLAHSGEAGATDVLCMLTEELVQTMQLTGCRSIPEIIPSMVTHESEHSSKL